MILELQQTFWVVTPKGQATVRFLIDRGDEADIQWVCIQQDTGEIWTWSNWDIRAVQNATMGRKAPSVGDS